MPLHTLRTALVLLLALSLLTGIVYPLLVTLVAQAAFPRQAQGSLLLQNGLPVASELVGQPFQDPAYFWGRPSATRPFPYNAAASAGSNLAPSNPALVEIVRQRIDSLRKADPGNPSPIPIDLVTASGSGLDPHISPAAAEYQVGRVARARSVDPTSIRQLVQRSTEDRTLGLLGEPRVPVVQLNRLLDRSFPRRAPPSR